MTPQHEDDPNFGAKVAAPGPWAALQNANWMPQPRKPIGKSKGKSGAGKPSAGKTARGSGGGKKRH